MNIVCKLLTKISMAPLAILVGMAKAWKKEVFSGPSPVFWAGRITFFGAIAPALAGAATCYGRKKVKPNKIWIIFHDVKTYTITTNSTIFLYKKTVKNTSHVTMFNLHDSLFVWKQALTKAYSPYNLEVSGDL